LGNKIQKIALRRIVRYTFLIANIIVALMLAATYVVPHINPKSFWLPPMVGLLYPYILFLNVCFVVFWGILYWRYALISSIIILSGFSIHQSYFQLLPRTTSSKTGIKILSYNVANFYSYLENPKKEKNILAFIASQNADIICLQETKLQKSGTLNPVTLKNRFPGIKHCQLAHQSSWNGPVTFSSYPIVQMGEIRFKNSNNMVIYSDIKIKQDTIRVYNCHLQSYGIKTDDYSVIDTLGFEDKKLKEMRAIGSKLKHAYIRRSTQVEKLIKHIESCKYPVIVCGDFNDTAISHTYHALTPALKDAFVESGSGISTTYRGKLPPNRIDYILSSKHFKTYNYKRYKVAFSDHYPISALLVKKN